MKIILKKLKINLEFSEETIMFKADLYINNKNAGQVENDGRGGCTYISYQEDSNLIQVAREYCDTLPKRKYDSIPDKEFEITLEDFIDELVDKKIKETEDKKMDKLCEKNIV